MKCLQMEVFLFLSMSQQGNRYTHNARTHNALSHNFSIKKYSCCPSSVKSILETWEMKKSQKKDFCLTEDVANFCK